MEIDKNKIEYVASLSRLNLPETEKDMFLDQLFNIFDYINKLNKLDTKDVAPMANAIELNNVFRDDVKIASILKQQALGNAPSKTPNFFKVPQVLDVLLQTGS